MKIFHAVERGIEIPENLDDLVIPEKTESKPEETTVESATEITEEQQNETASDQAKETDLD